VSPSEGGGGFDPTARVALGRTAVRVTQMAIGTVPLAGIYESLGHDDAIAVMEAAWAEGIRTFDTAPMYGHGFAERIVGEFLREQPRDSYVLSTKVGRLLQRSGPDDRLDRTAFFEGKPRFQGVGAENPYFYFDYDSVMRSIEASQERTGIERFDILLIHDPEDFMDEAIDGAYRALDELRSSGVVNAIGVGDNFTETHLEVARRADIDCILLAGRYTLLDQGALPELMPLCAERDIAVIAAGVFNSGILANPEPASITPVSGRAVDMASWNAANTFDYMPAEPDIIARATRIKAVCDDHGVPLAAAALQFPLHHPAVPDVLIGVREPGHVRANNEALRFPIPDALWSELKHEGLLPDEAPTP
jgi:D-threo-aldose 1-dehydrogenase